MPTPRTETHHSYPLPTLPEEDPSVAEALERVYDAGQGLLMRRLELLLEEGRGLLIYALAAGAGLLVAAGGWALVIAGALVALDPGPPRLIAAVVIGCAHLATGVIVAYRALRSAKAGPR